VAEKEEPQDGIKLNLRLPRELHSALVVRAKKNRRSLNNEMLIMLERLEKSEEILIGNGVAPSPLIESLGVGGDLSVSEESLGPNEDDWAGPIQEDEKDKKQRKGKSNNA